MDQSIRRRDRDEEQADELCRELFDAEAARRQAEYEAEFGPEFRAKHPFTVDSLDIHMTVMRQMEERRRDR